MDIARIGDVQGRDVSARTLAVDDGGVAGVGDAGGQIHAAGGLAAQRGFEGQLLAAFEDGVVGGRNGDHDAAGGAGRDLEAVGAVAVVHQGDRGATNGDHGRADVVGLDVTTQLEGDGGGGVDGLAQRDVERGVGAFVDVAGVGHVQLGHVSARIGVARIRAFGVDDYGTTRVGDTGRQRAAGRFPGQGSRERHLLTAFKDCVIVGRNRDNDASRGASGKREAVGAVGIRCDLDGLAPNGDRRRSVIGRFDLAVQLERDRGVLVKVDRVLQADVERGRGTFVHVTGVGDGNRGYVEDRRDTDIDDRSGFAAIAVVDDDRELVRTVVILVRRVGIFTRGRVEHQRAILRLLVDRVGQVVAVDVGADDLAANGLFLGRRMLIIGNQRCVIDRGDADLDDGSGLAAVAVIDDDRELIGAVIVFVRRVGVLAGGRIEFQLAVLGLLVDRVGQRVPIGIGASDLAADGLVFRRGVLIIGHHRQIVGASDGDGDGLSRCAAMAVVDGHGDGIGDLLTFGQGLDLGIVVVQHIGPLAVLVNREAAVLALTFVADAPAVGIGDVDIGHVELAGDHRHAVFGQSPIGLAGEDGFVVGANDGDSQCRGRTGAVFINQGIRKSFDQGLTHTQCLHSIQAAIKLIAVAAIGVEGNLAVQPLICADQNNSMLCEDPFAQFVVGEHIALQGGYRIFEDHTRISTCLGNACDRLRRRNLIRVVRQSAHPTKKWKDSSRWYRTSILQRQRRHRLNDAGKAHKSAATLAAARQCGRRGIQLIERILAGIDGRNDLVNLRIRGARHSRLFHGGRLNQVRSEMHILVLAHHQRWLTIRLQLHGAAGSRHYLGVSGNTHAFTEHRQIAIRTTHPSLASEFGNENGLSCHEGLPIQSD